MTRIEEFQAAAREYDLSTVRLHGYVKEWARHDVRDVGRLREQIAKADAAWAIYLQAAKGLNEPDPAERAAADADAMRTQRDLSDFGEPVF